jgi:hypothetical protein
MTFLPDLLSLLFCRSRALRALAGSRPLIAGSVTFAAGFAAFATVRNSVYSSLRAVEGMPDEGLWFVVPGFDVLAALTFVLVAYIPAVVALSNSMAGDGLGFSFTRDEYRSHAGVLLSLWGMLFLIVAPLQLVLPHFIVLVPDFLTISIGRLLLTVSLTGYTIWAIRGLNHLAFLPSIAVLVLSWVTWPVFYVLSRFVTSLPFFLLLPLGYVALQYVRTFLTDRERERELQAHLRSLTVNPRDADAHHQLGLICTGRGRFDEAERYLRSAVEIEPADPDHQYGLGRLFELRGDWVRALERYEETYRLNPQYRLGDILREVGKGYLQTGRVEKAKEFLDFFLGSRESDPEGHYWLAVAFQKLGKHAEARRQLNTILDQARSNPRFFRKEHRAWLQRARTLLRTPGVSWPKGSTDPTI